MSIRKQYDTDLESLKNSLTEMGRNSADAVEKLWKRSALLMPMRLRPS